MFRQCTAEADVLVSTPSVAFATDCTRFACGSPSKSQSRNEIAARSPARSSDSSDHTVGGRLILRSDPCNFFLAQKMGVSLVHPLSHRSLATLRPTHGGNAGGSARQRL